MPAWLVPIRLRHCIRSTPCSSRWVRTSPQALASALPTLGSLLFVSQRIPATLPAMPTPGMLAGCTAVAPLLRTHCLQAGGVVTADGPREWVDCIDARGMSQGRLYLLPDTDYLAWDTMLAGSHAAAVAPGATRCAPFEPGQARLVCFTHHRLAGLDTLGFAAAAPVSPLGQGIARDIARAEAVGLGDGAVAG